MDRFSKVGKVFVVGDFNSRMVALGDSSPNVVATAEFEAFRKKLVIFNVRYALGVPTYAHLAAQKNELSWIEPSPKR